MNNYQAWISKGDDDKLNAQSILAHRDGTPSGVCFLCQQMVEKYLKAYLIQHQQPIQKIHALDALLERCSSLDPTLVDLKEDVIYLTDFYITTRYPGDFGNFSWTDAERAWQAAENVQQRLQIGLIN